MATQITGRQIANGSIDDSKIASGANIATSKLADGANFLKKDASVAMTGNFDAGNNRIVNVSTPSGGNDAANKSYVDTQISNLNSLFDSKGSARAATTGNITISNPATNTFDTVTLVNGDRLLVKNQTAPAENGLYVFNGSSSALTRVADMDAWTEVPAAFVAVEEGSAFVDTIWLCTSNQGGTLGSTAITWFQIPTTGLSNSNFVDKEIPTGLINGSNVTYSLANSPVSGSECVFINGILQESGAGNDYTISGSTITLATAMLSGEKIRVNYRK